MKHILSEQDPTIVTPAWYRLLDKFHLLYNTLGLDCYDSMNPISPGTNFIIEPDSDGLHRLYIPTGEIHWTPKNSELRSSRACWAMIMCVTPAGEVGWLSIGYALQGDIKTLSKADISTSFYRHFKALPSHNL
jgi:hypothetical protein